MPPVRTNPKHKNAEGSTSKKQEKKSKAPPHQTKTNAIPGRQKLKASLRQARRLLAKEGLAANVKVETERRLKALEAELEQAEVATKERDFAVRYHKIKFFERQKVTRKLNQAKKALQSAEGSEKKKLEKELSRYRIDLNYILHYPKTKKYISLFPPEVRHTSSESSAPSPIPESDKTSQEREEIRTWVKECMEKGELSTEPELHLESDKSSHMSKPKAPSSQKFNTAAKNPPSKDDQKSKSSKGAPDIGQDDFFGNDDESSEESGSD
ncbi:hypothetical protein DFP72DRAFT_880369 [Ephemerocybe angulata]|uniref:rRNA-processing protein EFG1 n=1 Tax=Ephemerocybe angulata TaxID=980116 RepID=A0A8H6IB26_9AGAR|nr:hypothetical protein DFP72DRAFT_880369 [Tulosesus angulatus]